MSSVDCSSPGSHLSVGDAPLRIFHWLLVIAIAVAFLSAAKDSLWTDGDGHDDDHETQ